MEQADLKLLLLLPQPPISQNIVVHHCANVQILLIISVALLLSLTPVPIYNRNK